MSKKSEARAVMNAGLDAAIAIVRQYRKDEEALVSMLASNPKVKALVEGTGKELNAQGFLIILRHRHSVTNQLESVALDGWFNDKNKAATQRTIAKALAAIRGGI